MQFFFWFSVLLLAFASFVFISLPVFAHARPNAGGNVALPKAKILLFSGFLIAVSLAIYTFIGTPQFASKNNIEVNSKYAAIIKQVEAHLAQNPDDAEGWQVVAPTYLSLNQPEKAFNAFANAIKLGNSSGSNWLGMGKANLMINKGVFGQMTKVAFTKAVEKSPDDVEALYFYASMLVDNREFDQAKQDINNFLAAHELLDSEKKPLVEILELIENRDVK